MKTNKSHHIAFLAVLGAALLGGAIPVAGKIALQEVSPLMFTFLRFFIASIALIPFIVREKFEFKKDLWKVVAVSLFLTANVTLFTFGVKLTTATVAQLLYILSPILTVILSYFILKESITKNKMMGILLGFIGVLIIIILPAINKGSSLEGDLVGNLIILLAVVSFSFYSVFSKKAQQKLQVSPLILTFVFAVTTTLVLSVFVAQEYLANPSVMSNYSSQSIVSILYVGLIGGLAYYLLFQYAVKHGTALIASMVLFLQPIATFLWAWALLGEQLTLGIFVGGTLAFIGAYIVTLKS